MNPFGEKEAIKLNPIKINSRRNTLNNESIFPQTRTSSKILDKIKVAILSLKRYR